MVGRDGQRAVEKVKKRSSSVVEIDENVVDGLQLLTTDVR